MDRFDEYVEYALGPSMRRCSTVAIRIPSLPAGPLSVRSFHLEVPNEAGIFERVTHDFVTLDTDEMQRFAVVPPLETTLVRVVCTSNAAQTLGFNCIGFFDIEFA